MYTFGGPWLSGLLLFGILFLAACVFSLARMKFIGTDELPYPAPTHGYQIDHSFPYLESLNEVFNNKMNVLSIYFCFSFIHMTL